MKKGTNFFFCFRPRRIGKLPFKIVFANGEFAKMIFFTAYGEFEKTLFKRKDTSGEKNKKKYFCQRRKMFARA